MITPDDTGWYTILSRIEISGPCCIYFITNYIGYCAYGSVFDSFGYELTGFKVSIHRLNCPAAKRWIDICI
ncbi:hypothetical protein GCM10027566_20250 [Arachidicoccus ginsenosidivorans]|jgi:hypothetical protein